MSEPVNLPNAVPAVPADPKPEVAPVVPEVPVVAPDTTPPVDPPKRKRGRPRKNPLPVV